jgi:hypothetical protein
MSFTLLLLGLALFGQSEVPEPRTESCVLAPGLRAALQERFGTTRVLKASDLYEDERALFKADHPGACPGIAIGHFFGAKERPAVAIVLLDVEPKKNIRLVVARPALSRWTLVEVDELDAGTTAVVSKDKPGTYIDPHSATTKQSANDVVALLSYETWRRVYVWNGRTFEKLQTSE